MTQAEFGSMVEQYICPVLAGATAADVREQAPTPKLVSIADKGHTLLVGPTAQAGYRVAMRRS